MCDTNLAALLRAQNTCVYVTHHLIRSQQVFSFFLKNGVQFFFNGVQFFFLKNGVQFVFKWCSVYF